MGLCTQHFLNNVMSTRSRDSLEKGERIPMNDNNMREDEGSAAGGVCEIVLLTFSVILIVITFPISIFFCIRIVQEYERAVIFRLGRIKKGGAVGPGMIFVVPCTDEIRVMDLRTVSFDVPPQEILTKDSVTVSVDAVVYYNIRNPMDAVCNVSDYSKSTRLLSERDTIAKDLKSMIDTATDPWGIDIERVEVKDVRLPQSLQRAMAAEAEATRDARAKVIAAEGEQKASKALKEASDILSDSPAALQLRYLQTLTNISAEKNSTIIFPLPIDMMNKMVSK